MALTKKEVKDLMPFRSRGLDELARRVEDIRPIIDEMLKIRDRVTILEIGFGFGGCLMELRKRYGDKVSLVGINKTPHHGDWTLMKKVAVQRGLFRPGELKGPLRPELLYLDVSGGLPFPDDSFDIVYSQVAFMYFDDKARVIEEVNRVLKRSGIAELDVQIQLKEAPPQYRTIFEIWDGEKEVPFWTHVKRHKSMRRRVSPKRPYLEMRKSKRLDLKLRLLKSIDYNAIWPDKHGRKSVYAVRR